MRLGAELVGDLAKQMREEITAAEKASGAAIHSAGLQIKEDWRTQIVGAGLGNRLAKTVRSQTYPKDRQSLRAAALVWSKAPEIISSYDEGVLIKSQSGFFLAIPQPAAGRGRGGKRLTPYEWEQKTGLGLRLIYRKNGPSLLVASGARLNTKGHAVKSRAKTGRNQVTAIIFVLVPQVRLAKRLDLQKSIDAVSAHIPSRLVRGWNAGGK